ncbi:hypothetical protein ZWY2020_014732 [Hordeum vulgare]|nr:hypothetical protein ZWY2020_014732 [Hordeum vulgare]
MERWPLTAQATLNSQREGHIRTHRAVTTHSPAAPGLCEHGPPHFIEQLQREGALPNARTYTVVVSHLAGSGFVNQALEVFRLLPSLRIRRTTRQFNVLAEAPQLSPSSPGRRCMAGTPKVCHERTPTH